jgi:hypothetical protein
MARFQFNLRHLLTPRGAHPIVAQRSPHELQLDDARESPRGPGWFDSSWELSRGLEVHEGTPGDGRYDDWLVARAQVERRAAASRAARTVRKPPPDDFSRFGIDGLELA